MILIVNSDIFGKNLQYLRRQKELSMEAFSEILGIDADELKGLESGELRDLDYSLFEKICGIFSVEMQRILTEALWKEET